MPTTNPKLWVISKPGIKLVVLKGIAKLGEGTTWGGLGFGITKTYS
jgi:hypothetical protein